MFYGSVFMYNGVSSDRYNLFIGSMDLGENSSSSGSSDVNIFSETIYRKSKPYFFGTQQSPVLEYNMSFFSPEEMSAWDIGLIQKWLFGHSTHKKLQIVQPDVENMYWNVLLKSPQIIRTGNLITGLSCTASADSPFAYTYEKSITETGTQLGWIDKDITFYNLSEENYYLYPRLEIVTTSSGGNLSIKNIQDNNRISTFTVGANETLTIDNYRQILTSSTGLKRLSLFLDKNWFRLVNGKNTIRLNGDFLSFKMYYQFNKKMGG